MQEAYEIATKNMKKAAARGQSNYNKKAWSSVLEPGDHVLVRNLSERGGPGKLRAYWEKQTYVVKGRKGEDGPVYVIVPLDGAGKERVLHRNLPLPCPYLVDEQKTADVSLGRKEVHRNRSKHKAQPQRNSHRDSTCSSSEEFNLWVPTQRSGMDLDPRAAEFHPRRGKRNREPEKEPDIEEIAGEPGSLLDLERHSEESDEQVLGDFQGDQDLEEGSTGEVEHEEGDFASKAIRRTSARNRRPKNLYTYDTLSEPTLRPVNCSVCGEDADVVTCCIQPQLYPLY
ncbi:hypothetical protein QQF64_006342 [Cirrhinus molitorella]|uniref:Uncharacterized protein n=1 Tax=Cirrhinus molitorella TaxID=172907 RepID=A0ABR3MES0_9TELE